MKKKCIRLITVRWAHNNVKLLYFVTLYTMQNDNNANVECLGGKVSSKPHPIRTPMIVMPTEKLHSEQKLPNEQYSQEHLTKKCRNPKLAGIFIPKPIKVTVYTTVDQCMALMCGFHTLCLHLLVLCGVDKLRIVLGPK